MLGLTAPRTCRACSHFTAVLVAYVAAAKDSATKKLSELGSPGDRTLFDVAPDRQLHWRKGAPVTVRLSGEHLEFTPAERTFEWNGRENLVAFSVCVRDTAPKTSVVLCFHVFLGPIQLAFIPITIAVNEQADSPEVQREDIRLASSAFASYASRDAQIVLQKLSAITRWAPGLDIFQDCLDLKANKEFKPQLAIEINRRDVFLLFWSRNAAKSKWVRWEYEHALDVKGTSSILPMPVEDPAIVPLPSAFSDDHMRDRFLVASYALAHIQSTAEAATCRS